MDNRLKTRSITFGKNSLLKLIIVVGARPNFIKVAPLIREIENVENISYLLLHTGQHFDTEMSDVFFQNLEIPKPDEILEIRTGSPVSQIANIMIGCEDYFNNNIPDLVVVVGDVNSTIAATLAAAKMKIPVAHIEAGLRSRNWNMPEELNRVVTDRLSNILFTPTLEDTDNLINEGIDSEKITMVGNIMIDSLLFNLEKITHSKSILDAQSLNTKNYALLTLHRPECVDNKSVLSGIMDALKAIEKNIVIVWPIHPRTQKNLEDFNLLKDLKRLEGLKCIGPLGYLDFLSLMVNSKMVLTDSGGIQEETTVLGIPCLTLREETERPITVKIGTNKVVGLSSHKIAESAIELCEGTSPGGKIPPKWDGKTAKRIVDVILKWAKEQ